MHAAPLRLKYPFRRIKPPPPPRRRRIIPPPPPPRRAAPKKLPKQSLSYEQAPERLVEIIQNLSGNVPKERRESALGELIERFQFLTQKVAKMLYARYKLGSQYNYDYADLFQDVLVEFCDLALHDFRIKENPEIIDDSGFAPFGSYMRVKLYRRVEWKLQKRLKTLGWHPKMQFNHETLASEYIDGENEWDKETVGASKRLMNEINDAILERALNYEEEVMQRISDEKCAVIVKELIAISRDAKIIPCHEGQVWRLYWLSGLMVIEIKEEITKAIGVAKIRKIAKATNVKIIAEYGKRVAMRGIGMNGLG